MWRIGDRVIFMENGVEHSQETYGLKIGQIYTITHRTEVETNEDGHHDEIEAYVDDDLYKYAIDLDGRFWIEPLCFEKYTKKQAKNEADHLDNIRENFIRGF